MRYINAMHLHDFAWLEYATVVMGIPIFQEEANFQIILTSASISISIDMSGILEASLTSTCQHFIGQIYSKNDEFFFHDM